MSTHNTGGSEAPWRAAPELADAPALAAARPVELRVRYCAVEVVPFAAACRFLESVLKETRSGTRKDVPHNDRSERDGRAEAVHDDAHARTEEVYVVPADVARHSEVVDEVAHPVDRVCAIKHRRRRGDERRVERVHDEDHHSDEAAVRLEWSPLLAHLQNGF